MNKEEILDMPAGRKIDQVIATVVLGLPVLELKDAPCPYCNSEMHYCVERSWCSTCREWRYSPYRCYSDEIDAAWEVIEKMENLNGRRFMLNRAYFLPLVAWEAGWYSDIYERTGGAVATASSAPLAICRAALLAVCNES